MFMSLGTYSSIGVQRMTRSPPHNIIHPTHQTINPHRHFFLPFFFFTPPPVEAAAGVLDDLEPVAACG